MPRDSSVVQRLGLGVMACRYAEWGYAVLPLERGGKRPHRMLPDYGGVHWATTDQRRIVDWWTIDPAANIGVATGAASRLVVVDMDVKNGKDGIESFRQLLLRQGSIPWPGDGPSVWTPSGGIHAWLRARDAPERPGILPGVDIKGNGGYVVAPPSMLLLTPAGLDGEPVRQQVPVPYTWHGCPCLLPYAPNWLLHWMNTAPQVDAGDRPGLKGLGDLGELKKTGVPRGERNRTFYRLACSLYRRYGLSGADLVLTELHEVWIAGDVTDFGWAELVQCAASARKFIAAQMQIEREARMSYLDWQRHGGH